MTNSHLSIRDITHFGTAQEIHSRLLCTAEQFSTVCSWLKENKERTDRNVVLFNLLSVSAAYLHIATTNFQSHITVIA